MLAHHSSIKSTGQAASKRKYVQFGRSFLTLTFGFERVCVKNSAAIKAKMLVNNKVYMMIKMTVISTQRSIVVYITNMVIIYRLTYFKMLAICVKFYWKFLSGSIQCIAGKDVKVNQQTLWGIPKSLTDNTKLSCFLQPFINYP